MGNGNCVEAWRKSSYSYASGECVEVGDGIQVRDSKNPDVVLEFNQDAWRNFLASIKAPIV